MYIFLGEECSLLGIFIFILISIVVFFVGIFVYDKFFDNQPVRSYSYAPSTDSNAYTATSQKTSISKNIFRQAIGDYSFSILDSYDELAVQYHGEGEYTRKMKLNNLIACEIEQDNVVVKQSGISRALVGGVLAGGVGAVVGATTASERKDVQSIAVLFKTNDIYMPIVRFTVYTRGTRYYPNVILQQCDDLIASINLIIERKKEQGK